jgi:O-antigen/teichoic acid export membrane protein
MAIWGTTEVTLPVYVKIGGNKKRLLRAYLRIVALLVACNIVFVGFLLLFSGLLISYLGSDWGGIAVLLPILISYGFVMAIWGTTGSLFFSVGKPHILARLAVIRLIITLPLLGAGIYYFQAIGAAWALLISIILLLPITLYYLVSFFSSKE